jgi:asparagine synthase (glutamine-hydrolysing)
MCGIGGVVAFGALDLRGILAAMAGSLKHRGPDDEGIWIEPSAQVGFAHRRLAVIDLSRQGAQPMMSASGRFVISYNGEVYNHSALRKEIETASSDAIHWRGHSDTEVLLAGFEKWGVEETLSRVNGMFAFALWDARERTISLARDRMGEKPLYFGWIGTIFAFASEMKAFTCIPGWAPRMSVEAISSFLGTGYIRGPQSAVRGIFRLPPGSILELSERQMAAGSDWPALSQSLGRYWTLESTASQGLLSEFDDFDGAVNAFDELFRDAVAIRMHADVPLGAFLSGGIDSSLVTALMQAQTSRPVRTFSIGFKEPRFDEAPHARAIAQHLRTEHTELYVDAGDALHLVPELAKSFDEPFADTSQIPTMLVAALARKQVTVALSGDGGDELFAGYTRYTAILNARRILKLVPRRMRGWATFALTAAATALHPFFRPRQGLAHRIRRLAERLAVDDLDGLRLSFIGGTGLSRLRRERTPHDLTHCRAPAEIGDDLRRAMYGDQLDYLPDDILHKVDRATMLYGLEARVPLLDHRVVEISWRLPNEMLVDQGAGKQLLRRILKRYVPEELYERPKQGFAAPIDEWLRGPLRDWAEALLKPSSLQELPMLDGPKVYALWQEHLGGRLDAGISLWNVLMLADWRRRFQAVA